jgi:hypothetical protein
MNRKSFDEQNSKQKEFRSDLKEREEEIRGKKEEERRRNLCFFFER